MTIEDGWNILRTIKYKKGFTFELVGPNIATDIVCLKIQCEGVPSSRKSWMLLEDMSESDFVHRVFNEILNWERHEAGEFFLLDGIAVFSPHANVFSIASGLLPWYHNI